MRTSLLRKNMRLSLWHGAFFTAATTIVTTFFPLFLIDYLHASAQLVGLSSALPALAALIASLVLMVRLPKTPALLSWTTHSFLATRLSYLLIAVAPWLTPHHAALAAVLILTVGNIPQTWGLMGWQTIIGHAIPPLVRESFFSYRSIVTTLVALVVSLVTGLITQWGGSHTGLFLKAFFILAAGLGIAEVITLARHRLPVRPPASTPVIPPIAWRAIWQNPVFVRYLVLSAFFNFGWQMSWPLFSLYQIGQAHATALWLGLFTVAALISQAISFPSWRALARRQGGMRALGISALGLASVPWLTVLSRNLWILTGVNFESGLFLSGVNLLLFTELLAHIPPAYRTQYIVMYNVALGAVAFIAPEFGIVALHQWHMHGAMVLSSIWRACGAITFLAIGTSVERKRAQIVRP
ncbi:MAG: hypothetical protein C7B44_02150 [Sulfobacillus thermosulfidooxidans]|nr:MAG: hypothetical protein C7B44_02150 [Sulfobacillus thermosulfidooxidans]